MIKSAKKSFEKESNPLRLTIMFLAPLLLIMALFVVSLIAWERKNIDENQIADLRDVARAFFEQIMVTRIWNSQHGGVYVQVTENTPPNPFLDDPHREIVTADGKRFTKINPAYMTREMSEIANKHHGYKFRVVSLRPINPSNFPDEWERKALTDLETGRAKEAMTVFRGYHGARLFKYIAPIQIDDPCFKCHASEGYGHGDIRGAINITIPMENSDAIQAMKIRRSIISMTAIGLLSSILLSTIVYYLARRLSSEISKNIEQEKLSAIVELSGATAHELRQPMTVVQGVISLTEKKAQDGKPMTQDEMDMIKEQCVRMNDIIKKMLSITSYKTKDYIKGKKIVDLDGSSSDTQKD
ncbi:MAG: DUF3365 domain-containing protein [Nitrospirae bacterium]|nr:MAG: DUF3365 domain-containing protein [Nitrospirota bacterium]